MGGQRLGEMEVWGLESHRAAHTLQEMLTIKSDDVVGRAKAFEAMIKGEDIPDATVPESFKVLIRELNALCLSIDTKGGKPAVADDTIGDDTFTFNPTGDDSNSTDDSSQNPLSVNSVLEQTDKPESEPEIL